PFGSFFVGKKARGTAAAPTAVQTGDGLVAFSGEGYGATGFSGGRGGMSVVAAENWTDAAQGAAVGMYATPIGSNVQQLDLGILANGNVGIGTPPDASGLPTATDKLQVFGDARVGNAGTNGCLRRFDGTGLAGSCSSDRR